MILIAQLVLLEGPVRLKKLLIVVFLKIILQKRIKNNFSCLKKKDDSACVLYQLHQMGLIVKLRKQMYLNKKICFYFKKK